MNNERHQIYVERFFTKVHGFATLIYGTGVVFLIELAINDLKQGDYSRAGVAAALGGWSAMSTRVAYRRGQDYQRSIRLRRREQPR